MLKVNGISVRYDIIPVLENVSFSVEQGQFVAIVGANSAGKTSILKTISGLVSPFEGSIEFMSQPIQALAPYAIAARGIAHVPEGRRIFDKLTVRENMLVGAHTRDKADEVDKTLQEMFGLFPILKERQDKKGGGKQKQIWQDIFDFLTHSITHNF